MSTRITTLIENSMGEHLSLKAEHGISFFVEKGNTRLLLDMGQGGSFLENAAMLGIDPSTAHFAAISHGHYDHGGGFRSLVAAGFKGTLLTGKGIFDKKYAADGVSLEYLGLDFDEEFLKAAGIRHLVVEQGIEKIAEGIFALTVFPRVHKEEILNPRFRVERNGAMVIDDFSDEICLAVETARGFVLLLGCSHPGLMNILDAARGRLPGPVHAIMGGTHLVEASPERLALAVDYLEKSEIEVFGVSHCTGAPGVEALSKTHKKFFKNSTGHSLLMADTAADAADGIYQSGGV